MLNPETTHRSIAAATRNVATANPTQRVVIVNGSLEVLELIETILKAGHYDVVFVESNQHAYSQIRRVQPDLVILCVRIDSLDGFQVLSMLKLDEKTREIPVLTYTTEYEGQDSEKDATEVMEQDDVFAPRFLERMN
jgi:CheY-like chemotaxis protein